MHSINLTLTAGCVALLITPATAFFRMSCPGRLVRERLDPIVNPGAVSGHLHTIFGGSAFGPSMTYQQARNAACSSCEITEDSSNYWTPQMYYQAQNGSFFPVPVVGDGDDSHGGMVVYYLQRGLDGEQLHAFPEGFRMLAGDPFKRNFTGGLDAQAISFACLGQDEPETNSLPNYNCPGGLRAQVFFPACWNGNDLDSPDHRSHMSYPAGSAYNTGGCPAAFPVHLISIFYEILYDTNSFANEWYGGSQPFVFSNGDPTGYGFHGDFINGWDIDVLQRAVDNCTAESGLVSDCHEITAFPGNACQACRLPPVIDEPVDGWLSALPGCNPVFSGPASAPTTPCTRTSISPSEPDYIDLTSQGWEYTGCGTDSGSNRTFSGTTEAADDMTIENCIAFCNSRGFSYAGLEYSKECWCDNSLPVADAPKQGILGFCIMKCGGNSTELCGGPNALSIYHKCAPGFCANTQFNASAASAATPSSGSTRSNTPTPSPPDCPRNNCVNEILNPSIAPKASGFCQTYTRTKNTYTVAIPTYLENCENSPVTVSSACSCLMYSTPTPTPTLIPTGIRARNEGRVSKEV